MRQLLIYLDNEGEQKSIFDKEDELDKFIRFQESLPERFEVCQIIELPELIEPILCNVKTLESINNIINIGEKPFKAKQGKELFKTGNFRIDMTGEWFTPISKTPYLCHKIGIFKRSSEKQVDLVRVFVPEISNDKLSYCIIKENGCLLIRQYEPDISEFICGVTSFEGCEILKEFIKSKL